MQTHTHYLGLPITKVTQLASYRETDLTTAGRGLSSRNRSAHEPAKKGSMIISLSMNITMNRLGGASVIAIFTTRRSHGYVNTTTWLGISQFFLFLVPNFNILTMENRSRCNRDLN